MTDHKELVNHLIDEIRDENGGTWAGILGPKEYYEKAMRLAKSLPHDILRLLAKKKPYRPSWQFDLLHQLAYEKLHFERPKGLDELRVIVTLAVTAEVLDRDQNVQAAEDFNIF